MNNKLEELSKKLDAEIEKKQEKERREEFVEGEATAAGVWGAIKYGLGYGFVGFLIAGLFELFGWEILKYITLFGSIILGGFIGYSEESQEKRNRLR
jgi:uncharacterized membrane protein YhiD involved in acid resistance